MNRRESVPLNVSVSPETKRQLEELAHRKEMSVSAIVRIGLIMYIDECNYPKNPKGRKK
jgi:hypothetical protein